jgi:hypothetical protein
MINCVGLMRAYKSGRRKVEAAWGIPGLEEKGA